MLHTPGIPRPLLITGLLFVAVVTTPLGSNATDSENRRAHHERPKLVVGIMVDQMRYDYLYRYWEHYGEGGFRRLLDEGFSFDNAHLDYVPPFTGPGHASVYTGTTPANHGIVGNEWYLRGADRITYATADGDVDPIGSDGDAGRMSPRWLEASTISDELILHSNQRSRVVAFSLKDRGSILAAGHLGDAYWFDPESANVISSSHYMDALPDWVVAFNEQGLPAEYVATPWETLRPIEEYAASIEDDNPYAFELSPTFPHPLPAMAAELGAAVLQFSPRGNTFTFDFARAAIAGANLGADEHTDLLAISLSSPDYIGHVYAPASIEVEDTYLRLDRELAAFLDHLDQEIGLDDVLVFLTSDHGVAYNPAYLRELGFPADYVSMSGLAGRIRAHLETTHGVDLLQSFSNGQVFLDHAAMATAKLSPAEVEQDLVRYLLRDEEAVAGAIGATTLNATEFTTGIRRLAQNGFHQKRSGDVALWFAPQWLPEFRQGTGSTHASVYSYDNRLPLIFFGWDIPAGRSTARVGVADIAPTLAVIMNTAFPTSTTGTPLQDLIHRR